MSTLLIHATGFAALALNVGALMGRSDRSLRSTTGWASALWAVNNLLLGAQSAAALSLLSVGRQASAVAVHRHRARVRHIACAGFVLLTLVLGALTWNGVPTLFTSAGSLLATGAMFYLRGSWLRLAMIGVAALWMVNAWVYASWWQMLANLLTAGAAAYGAWRAERGPRETVPRQG